MIQHDWFTSVTLVCLSMWPEISKQPLGSNPFNKKNNQLHFYNTFFVLYTTFIVIYPYYIMLLQANTHTALEKKQLKVFGWPETQLCGLYYLPLLHSCHTLPYSVQAGGAHADFPTQILFIHDKTKNKGR